MVAGLSPACSTPAAAGAAAADACAPAAVPGEAVAAAGVAAASPPAPSAAAAAAISWATSGGTSGCIACSKPCAGRDATHVETSLIRVARWRSTATGIAIPASCDNPQHTVCQIRCASPVLLPAIVVLPPPAGHHHQPPGPPTCLYPCTNCCTASRYERALLWYRLARKGLSACVPPLAASAAWGQRTRASSNGWPACR